VYHSFLTYDNQPLGKTVGTWLEIQETIELIQGQGDSVKQDLILPIDMKFI
jgi:thymidine phosphorylase